MSLNYKQKYLKYKLKYLTTKKLYGGMNTPLNYDLNGDFRNAMKAEGNVRMELPKLNNAVIDSLTLKTMLRDSINNIGPDFVQDVIKKNLNTEDLGPDGQITTLLIDIYYGEKKTKDYLKDYCGKTDLDLVPNSVDDLIRIATEFVKCLARRYSTYYVLQN